MKKNFLIALWFTLVTTVIFGVLYPLAITGLAQVLFPDRANEKLIERNRKVVGSRIIGQAFSGPGYFHSRPSSAGTGYDPTSSGGSNLGPTNKTLLERVTADVQRAQVENPSKAVPIDLVTASASGLDPDFSPASAEFQIPHIARERHMAESGVRALVARYTHPRFRQDVFRVRRIALNLLPKLVDHHAQILGLFSIIRPPDGLQQSSVGERFSLIRDQQFQHFEFFRGQMHVLTARHDGATLKIDGQILRFERYQTVSLRNRRRPRPARPLCRAPRYEP